MRARYSRSFIRAPFVALVVLLLLLVATGSARAENGTLVLASGDAELERAAAVAFRPWSIRVVVAEAAALGSSNDTMARADALAREHAAGGVAWISSSPAGTAIFVYDARTKQLTSRELATGPPYDAANAAAVSLTLKTMLRESTIAPEAERVGAPPQSRPPEPPASPRPPESSRFTLEALPIVRAVGSGGHAEPRLALGAAYWPSRLGIALLVSGGAGAAVGSDAIEGKMHEATLVLMLRVRLDVAAWARIEFGGGAGASLDVLDARLPLTGERANVTRVNPTLLGTAVFDWRASRHLALGAFVGLGYRTRHQTFFSEGEALSRLPAVFTDIGLRLSLDL